MSYLDTVGIGDSLEYLKQLPDNSVDSVVSDAPYGLGAAPDPVAVMMAWARGRDVEIGGGGFMSKKWDAFVPQPSMWREVIRVLKPGGYALVFFGTRTYDWGVMSMRFAGFEVVDKIDWLYGSGFPKSLDIAKAIDKRAGVEPLEIKPSMESGILSPNSDWNPCHNQIVMPPPTTDEAKTWAGWGTQLKPSHEPVVVARKPLAHDAYIDNVMEHGTGALNVDDCRVGWGPEGPPKIGTPGWGGPSKMVSAPIPGQEGTRRPRTEPSDGGRWPANVILSHHDGCTEQACAPDCAVAGVDHQSGVTKSSASEKKYTPRKRGSVAMTTNSGSIGGEGSLVSSFSYGDEGGASRYFYTAKAQSNERWSYCKKCQLGFQHSVDNFAEHAEHRKQVVSHPTQKPVDLMRYLIQLVTQKGGVVLDPYAGTGTTAIAAKQLGYHYVTCELDADYAKIAQTRLTQVGSSTTHQLQSGAFFCPGCEAKGIITLISRTSVDRMRESGKKTTCMKCMKRYTHEELIHE